MVHVRHVTPADRNAWLRMRCDLWPEGDAAEHAAEIERFFAGRLREPLAVLIAADNEGKTVGFAELSIRRYAEECETDRVGYLEGWYVVPEARRQGVGRALVEAAFGWAVERGCVEFASDALLDNAASASAHRALGFQDAVEVRCFKRPLNEHRWISPPVRVLASRNGFIVRESVMSDARALADLVSELGYPTTGDQMRARLETILADSTCATLVAVLDGRIAGFIGISVRQSYELDGTFAQIMALVVAGAYQRRGIGRELVGCAERLLATRGVSVVIVNTGNQRLDAHAFYEKNGYVFTGRRYRKTLT
jgi:aminoglycoside 6'-N-acetyltransferase I